MQDNTALLGFITAHLQDNPSKLLLKYAKAQTGFDVKDAVLRIAAIQKLTEKAPSWALASLRFSNLQSVEQCSSEATALYKARQLGEAKVLDLSGGLGLDSWAMAKLGAQVTYVEQEPDLANMAKYNFEQLGVGGQIQVCNTTAEQYLRNCKEQFDCIYLDPDRRKGGRRFIDLSDCSPDITVLLPQLFEHTDLVLLKASPMLDLSAVCLQLQGVERIDVIGWQGECKELLFRLKKGHLVTPIIQAVEIDTDGTTKTALVRTHNDLEPELSEPLAYLYDPPASVLKAGCFSDYARRFSLKKLHPSTHLFTSELPVEGVPGRRFGVEAVINARREEVHRYLPKAQVNLRCVNFPQTTEVLKKQLGLKDGGDQYVFAVTLADETKKLILCKKIPV
jgi:hypothetical protein